MFYLSASFILQLIPTVLKMEHVFGNNSFRQGQIVKKMVEENEVFFVFKNLWLKYVYRWQTHGVYSSLLIFDNDIGDSDL